MAHERLKFDGVAVDRDGSRLLPTRLLSSPECHASAQDLVRVVCSHDPVQLLTGIAFSSLLLHSSDSHPTFVEYLQHLILTHAPVGGRVDVSEELANELFLSVRDLFGSVCGSSKCAGARSDSSAVIQDSLALDALYVRGKSYAVHQIDLLERLLVGVEDWLIAQLNISAGDVVRTVRHLLDESHARATATLNELRQPHAREAGASYRLVMGGDVFLVDSPDLGIAKVLRALSASPGSRPTPPSLLPGAVWATSRDYPILEIGGKHYCFNPQSVMDELPRIVGEWIAGHDQGYFDRRYARLRESVLTDVAIEALQGVLPGARWGKNLFYSDPAGNRCETDGVILYDDVAVVIEAKAGALSYAARQGKPKRVERDFRALVGRAFSQGRRTAEFIGRSSGGVFLDEGGNPALRLDARGVRQVYVVNPVMDSMDAFAIELASARASGFLGDGDTWPWCVFINELRVVTDVLDSPSLFLFYLERRLRFNAHSEWFRVHDETDLLDYFVHTGMFLERKPARGVDIVQWQADTRNLDRYYEARVLNRNLPEKPRPPCLPEIAAFVRSIEGSGVYGRTVLAGEILGLGETCHRRMRDILQAIPARLSQRHHPQCGVFCRDGLGVSIWFTEEYSPGVREQLRFEDAWRKHEKKAPEWISAAFLVGETEARLVEVTRNVEPWRADREMDLVVRRLRDERFAMHMLDARPGRNDPCPCGSGRKFKKCHGNPA